MRPYLSSLLVLLVVYSDQVFCQVTDTTERFFLESSTFASLTSIESGEEYTKGRIERGVIFRTLYRIPLSKHVKLSTGLGFGIQELSQRSQLDRKICQELAGRNCEATSESSVVANHTGFTLEVPLQLRVFLSAENRGLYLTGGAAWHLPLFRSLEVYGVAPNGDENFLREGRVSSRIYGLLSTGVGYQFRYSKDFAWYLEITGGTSTGLVVEDAGERNEDLTLNYFRSASMKQLGVTAGVNF